MSLREYIEERSIPIPFVGCWLWLQSFASHGYGNARMDGKNTTAQRASYVAFKGSIAPGLLVQHSCDNKWCVNPDHLSLGTDATNALDKQMKGRAARKLTAIEVGAIKASLESGHPKRAIARAFNVSQRLVQGIARGGIWTHV